MKWLVVFVGIALASAHAAADDTITLKPGTDLSPYRFDAGAYAGMPAGLPAGIEPGIGLGVMRECGCAFAYGARLAIAGITESSEEYTASDLDFRARLTVALRHVVGRGELALRLGGGANIVYEDRVRNGGDRAGLTGDALQTRTVAALPAGDLEGVISLHVIGGWLVIASAGPTAEILNSSVHGGFVGGLAIGWQP